MLQYVSKIRHVMNKMYAAGMSFMMRHVMNVRSEFQTIPESVNKDETIRNRKVC